MSKKEKVPSTPESRAQKLARKAEKKKIFGKTFETAFALFLSFALVYSVCYISFHPTASVTAGTSVNTNTNSSGNNSSGSSGSSGSSSSGSSESTTAPTGSSDGNTNSDNDASTASPNELSASSSAADVVNYFNTAINKVKPNAKQITLNKEVNSQTSDISGSIPSMFTGLVNSAISANMGEKDLSSLEPSAVNATTTEAKNTMFPVENQSWSSKLTADDIESKNVTDNGSSYEITLKIKADEASSATAAGNGHGGKVFSVISPNIILENAEKFKLSSLIKDCKTGTTNGVVKVTVDKATGNVTNANYYFDWTLDVTIIGGLNVKVGFGIEKDFTIAW